MPELVISNMELGKPLIYSGTPISNSSLPLLFNSLNLPSKQIFNNTAYCFSIGFTG